MADETPGCGAARVRVTAGLRGTGANLLTPMSANAQSETITVHVDPDIVDLIPGFMANRREDVSSLNESLRQGDYETVRITGHSMKGSGGGYGFDAITDIGAALEKAAERRDAEAIRLRIEELRDYLERVRWVVETE